MKEIYNVLILLNEKTMKKKILIIAFLLFIVSFFIEIFYSMQIAIAFIFPLAYLLWRIKVEIKKEAKYMECICRVMSNSGILHMEFCTLDYVDIKEYNIYDDNIIQIIFEDSGEITFYFQENGKQRNICFIMDYENRQKLEKQLEEKYGDKYEYR